MYVCIHTYIQTCINTYIHTCNIHIHTHTHTHTHTCIRMYIHAYIHTYMYTNIHIHIIYIHIYPPTQPTPTPAMSCNAQRALACVGGRGGGAETVTPIYAYTHTHTHTHTHTCMDAGVGSEDGSDDRDVGIRLNRRARVKRAAHGRAHGPFHCVYVDVCVGAVLAHSPFTVSRASGTRMNDQRFGFFARNPHTCLTGRDARVPTCAQHRQRW